MDIMNDAKLFVLAEKLKEKSNDILRILDFNKKVEIGQYKDHYSYKLSSDNVSIIISINGKGTDEEKYYPELLDFLDKILLAKKN